VRWRSGKSGYSGPSRARKCRRTTPVAVFKGSCLRPPDRRLSSGRGLRRHRRGHHGRRRDLHRGLRGRAHRLRRARSWDEPHSH